MIKPDVNFSQRNFTEFREDFCSKNVRQGMIVTLLEFVLDTASVSDFHVSSVCILCMIKALRSLYFIIQTLLKQFTRDHNRSTHLIN